MSLIFATFEKKRFRHYRSAYIHVAKVHKDLMNKRFSGSFIAENLTKDN